MSNLVFNSSHVTFSPVSCFTCSTSSFAFVERASRVTKTPTCSLAVDAGRLDTFAEQSFDPLQVPCINAVWVGVAGGFVDREDFVFFFRRPVFTESA